MAHKIAHNEQSSSHAIATRAPALVNETTVITTTTTIVRSTTMTETTTRTTTTTQHYGQPFRFLDLPAELRMQVYEYLVVVGKVFYTPDSFEESQDPRFKEWDYYPVPSLQILRVNKQIHREAEDLYLSSNLFVLPWNFEITAPFSSSSYDLLPWVCRRPLFSSQGLKVIKNISVSFCTRSVEPLTMTASEWALHSPHGDFEDLSEDDRLHYAHDTARGGGYSHMDIKSDRLACITSKLQYLEIDFTNTYCPVGCCRMVDINGDFLTGLDPAIIRVLGVREGEKEELPWPLSKLKVSSPEDDPWARHEN
ncbi:hypothetical protein FB567DRAFT_528250 [Paraphoma chrysanthemicola]|uniref:F-box domain-containing protein n=1 Tax=Paraphoma chrysanthemicola TaxID=798071 RepID=A0A8K0R707_9PLEO|nr:hypothetical protein FB567DRAFT_528250 [Paraphoma chrysanthemicola]